LTTIDTAQLTTGDVLRSTPLESIKRGLAGFFVKSGCKVTDRTPETTYIDVASGVIFYDGGQITSGASALNLAPYIDPDHPKIIILYIDSAGVVQVHDGVAETEDPLGETDWDLWDKPCPATASLPNGVPLVEIRLGMATTAIGQGDIKSVAMVNTNYAIASIDHPDFWELGPTATRVSDTQFTVSDPSNASRFDLIFAPTKIIRWFTSGAARRTAKVISSSYLNDIITVNIVGDLFEAGANAVEYAYGDIKWKDFQIAGFIGTGPGQGETFPMPYAAYIISIDAFVAVAGTTNSLVVDVNASGNTLLTTKPTITTGTTSDIENMCDAPHTAVAKGALITIDVDATCTVQPQDLMVRMYFYPAAWENT
jgi:hypothetical protein